MREHITPALIRGEAAARDYLGGLSHGSMWALERQGVVKPIFIGRLKYYSIQDLDQAVQALRQGALRDITFQGEQDAIRS
jgi:hypothetical protein